MGTRAARQLRGWAVALSATGVAAAAHILAGGSIPHPSILVLCLALSAMVSCALAGRALSHVRTAGAVLVSQGLFHWMFTAGGAGMPSPAGGFTGLSTAGAAAGHAGHAGHVDPGALADQVVAGAGVTASGHPSAGMWFGHLLAAAATMLIIGHGEAALLRLAGAVRLRIVAIFPRLPLPAPLGPEAPKPAHMARIEPAPRLGIPLLVMRHRGPPAAAAFR
ncbi:hypothetical protein MUK71_13420 [Arthrobacter zhangbolii]|uniref:Uncharacterized protein n=1 Tax=Arthrobacter zhangbolii TaxID=2886936 RepID=A0A9X1M711_9MICC|nr:hypothetical protein [Arthrobacter zhangbolii]MCC3272574.1 hypothetical protein [Arthrobacter zhangbolii]UON91576.1 hypothetical protein MUK71_13420 [Arthrobacter zhangbolii]